MHLYLQLFLIFFCLIVDTANAKAANSPLYVGLHWVGWTFHPGGGSTPELYPLKLDKQGTNVIEVGGMLKLDYALASTVFSRVAVAAYKDCSFSDAGFIHFGLRGEIFRAGAHAISGGLGPTLLFRRDWHRFPDYEGDAFFGERVAKGFQYRFIWYGGEFDYSYRIHKETEFQFSLIPGYPFVLTSTFGLRHRF